MNNTPSLLPCPFCGAPAHGYAIAPHSHSPAVLRLVPELPDHPGSYVIEGQCACGSGLIGANESEVTARWNRRTPHPDVASGYADGWQDGMPCEKRKAIQEGEQIGASDAWFKARHEMLDTIDRRNVFRAGFDRGWSAALAAQGGKV